MIPCDPPAFAEIYDEPNREPAAKTLISPPTELRNHCYHQQWRYAQRKRWREPATARDALTARRRLDYAYRF
jgi:hypothetical protein